MSTRPSFRAAGCVACLGRSGGCNAFTRRSPGMGYRLEYRELDLGLRNMTEVSISATTTTTKAATTAQSRPAGRLLSRALLAALRATIRTAWRLNSLGTRWWWRLDSLPVWVPGVLWRLCRRLQATGEALEAWAERTAEKHGIDILDVIAPLASVASWRRLR
jgi:hypothetical protein